MALSFSNFNFGKYKGILISVALFLLLDASVLILNFFISFQIADDAVYVNLAGRQRMLSQRTAKSLFELETELLIHQKFNDVTLKELRGSTELFDATLYAFMNGGTVSGAKGADVKLEPVKDSIALTALNSADERWGDYKAALSVLLSKAASNSNDVEVTGTALSNVLRIARKDNLPLLTLMNDFTVALERVATSKANRLRIIQTIGISLAILNFLFILFHFVRQLRESDAVLEEARSETVEILNNVNEGLFLVDANYEISSQYSKELESILCQNDLAGKSFKAILQNMVSEKETQTSLDFVALLFNPDVRESLIGDLNPLDQIKVSLIDESGVPVTRFLSFSFSRAENNGVISYALVTVTDVTEKVLLAKELDAAKNNTDKQINMLASLLHASPSHLKSFIERVFETCKTINDTLKKPKKPSDEVRTKLDDIFIEVHKFKGDASSLQLEGFSDRAHEFEEKIQDLRQKEHLSGNDFLSLTVNLEELLEYTEKVKDLVDKMAQFAGDEAARAMPQSELCEPLKEFVQVIAQRHGKEAYLTCGSLVELPENYDWANELRPILIQLLRNSVVHGIETPEKRQELGKPLKGRIDIHVAALPDDQLEVVVQDDGAGFDYDSLRESVIASGKWPNRGPESWTRQQLILTMFKPDISTAKKLSEDAGRGIGLPAVLDWVEKYGSLGISTREGRFTRFTMTLKYPNKMALVA